MPFLTRNSRWQVPQELILHPSVEERLKRLKASYITGHRPENIPAEQI
ncbi:MAG: hypothetical protein QMC83_00895 [Thermodesulfovibrionales bacterium]|nr:hypothetical protein [Thermodesulfovibrionales bacterium]